MVREHCHFLEENPSFWSSYLSSGSTFYCDKSYLLTAVCLLIQQSLSEINNEWWTRTIKIFALNIKFKCVNLYFLPWRNSHRWTTIHDHTQTHTLGRTSLDEWSARRRDLYLTTHTRDRHPCPPAGFEPTIPAIEWLQTHTLDCTVTGIASNLWICVTSSLCVILDYLNTYISVNTTININ